MASATSTATAYDRVPDRGTEPASLAEGDELDRVDVTDLVASGVEDTAGVQWDAFAEEVAPSSGRRDEAHVLAVRLARRAETHRRRPLADLVLAQLTHREQHPGQLPLPEHVEHVGLVLRAVGGSQQPSRAVRGASDARVVPSRDRVEPEEVGPLEQTIELEVAVALDARVGGPA